MKQAFTLLLITSCLMAACTSEKQKLTHAIEKKEKELMADSLRPVDRKKANDMIDLYRQYAEKFPDDTASYEYIFKAGDISNGIGAYREAIAFYKTASSKPAYRKSAVALFLQGFIYENQLGDYFQAKAVYQLFLDKYPDHALTDDVKYSMENLGKSPEELIKQFENQQMPHDSIAVR